MEFQEKFIAFIDILGFKDFVHKAESDDDMQLSELADMLKHLGSQKDVQNIKQHGPTLCPESDCIEKDINFNVTQISDCAIISSEVSPLGAINIVNHCWGAVIKLLMQGFMCRGYITRGKIYHTDTQFIGSGYQKALSKESEVAAFQREVNDRGTPYVEVDSIVCNYIESTGDRCIKEMFSRLIKKDGDTTVLFPFQRLGHSFILMGGGVEFDPLKEKDANNNIRLLLHRVKDAVNKYVDTTNPSAVLKSKHYLAALNKQLDDCDKTDEVIEMWS